jgi:hypothetical protein
MLLVGEFALAPGLVSSGCINASCAALQRCALIMGHGTCSSRIASSSPSSSLSIPQRVSPSRESAAGVRTAVRSSRLFNLLLYGFSSTHLFGPSVVIGLVFVSFFGPDQSVVFRKETKNQPKWTSILNFRPLRTHFEEEAATLPPQV